MQCRVSIQLGQHPPHQLGATPAPPAGHRAHVVLLLLQQRTIGLENPIEECLVVRVAGAESDPGQCGADGGVVGVVPDVLTGQLWQNPAALGQHVVYDFRCSVRDGVQTTENSPGQSVELLDLGQRGRPRAWFAVQQGDDVPLGGQHESRGRQRGGRGLREIGSAGCP